MKDINVNRMIERLRQDIDDICANHLSKKLGKPVSEENPIEWENDMGKFKLDGEFLYVVPKRPIERVRVEFKIVPSGTLFDKK